jgi:hypothetical protein
MKPPPHSLPALVALFFLFSCSSHAVAGEYIKGALHYDPPVTLYPVELNHDPGDNPFSGDGPGLGFLSRTDANRGFGSVTFQFGMVGFAIGEGKRVTYSAVGTNELRRIFGDFWTETGGDAAVVHLTSIGGLPAVTARGTGKSRQTQLFEATWVQIKTNVVLKITVAAENQSMFDVLTNSLKSVEVDSEKFFESLRPKEPKILQFEVTSIEMGFAPLHGRSWVPAFVFHTKNGEWSIVSGEHFNQKEENIVFQSLTNVLDGLSKKSSLPNVRCRTTIDTSKVGNGSNDVQKIAAFHVVEQQHPLHGRPTQKLEGEQPFLLSSVSDKEAPEGFQKVRELTFKMELVIEKYDLK